MTGLVGRNVELNDDELGFVASDELNPQKSRILLSLALLKKPTPAQLQTMYQTYSSPSSHVRSRCPYRRRHGHGTGGINPTRTKSEL